MSFNIRLAAGVVLAAMATAAYRSPTFAQVPPQADGGALFDQRCKSCHEPPVGRAPSRTALAARPRADIVTALTSGVMAPMATGLSPADIQAVAAYLTPAPREAGEPKCQGGPPIRAGASDWASLGVVPASTRYQPHPGLSVADVPKLKLKWSFAMSGGGQPTVVGDWLFVTNRSGKFYALDARTGCVRWVVTGAASRTTPMIVRSAISPSGWATFIGAYRRLRAIDAQTGAELWKSEPLETHPASGVTGSPIVAGDRIFVPITSGEEVAADVPTYACCSFRGSLVAVDLKTGKKLWQTYVITEPMHPLRKNAKGVQMQGPAGAAIWSSPAVDTGRGLIYVATGDSYTEAPTKGSDALVAIDMKTGKVRWSTQVTAGDNYVNGCGTATTEPVNCPNPSGPDYDFGASPILFTLAGGRQVLVAGQKSGLVYGFNPDNGRLLWTTRVGTGSALGGVEWGLTSDKRHVFAADADTVNLLYDYLRAHGMGAAAGKDGPARPGLTALNPATGRIVWSTPAPDAPCHYAGARKTDYLPGVCLRAQSAAPSAMPGAVFSGTLDGWLRAYDPVTGKIIWAFSTTAQTYNTVNGVNDQPGGGIDGMGPTIAGGMVYTMSGFNGASNTGGNNPNVLLAFSVDGR